MPTNLTRPQPPKPDPSTVSVAKAIGVVLSQKSDGDDIVDAHAVMLGRHYRLPVITSDPGDLLALDPKLDLILI